MGVAEVKVVITGEDQGGAAQVLKLRDAVAQLNVPFTVTTEGARAAGAAVGESSDRMLEATRAASGMAFEMEGLARGGRFAALEMGRFAESITALIPGFGEFAIAVGIVATALGAFNVIREELSQKQDKADAILQLQIETWRKLGAAQLETSLKAADAAVAQRRAIGDQAEAQASTFERIKALAEGFGSGDLTGVFDRLAQWRTAQQSLNESIERSNALRKIQQQLDDEAANRARQQRTEFEGASFTESRERGQRISELRAAPTSQDPTVRAQQELHEAILKTNDAYAQQIAKENERFANLQREHAVGPDQVAEHGALLGQIGTERAAALANVQRSGAESIAKAHEEQQKTIAESDLAVTKEGLDEQRAALKASYDERTGDARAHYAALLKIDQDEIRAEIATRAEQIGRTRDPTQVQVLQGQQLIAQMRLEALPAENAAALAKALAEQAKASAEEARKTLEQVRQTISGGIGETRSALGEQVEAVRAGISTGSITKAEGAKELAADYGAALATLRTLYGQAEALAAVTQDPRDKQRLEEIAEAYRKIQAQAQEATAAASEFARALGDAAGKAFSQIFDALLDKSRSVGQEIRKAMLDVVKDLEHAVTEPVSKQVNETVRVFTASLLPKSKTEAGAVPTPQPNALINAGPALTSAGSSLSAAASRLSAAAAHLSQGGSVRPTRSASGGAGRSGATGASDLSGADIDASGQSPEDTPAAASPGGAETVTETAASSAAGALLSVPEIKSNEAGPPIGLELIQDLTRHISSGAPLASGSSASGAGALDSSAAALKSSASALTQAATQLTQAAAQLSQSGSGGAGGGLPGMGGLGSILGGAGDAGAAAGAGAGAGAGIGDFIGEVGGTALAADGGYIRGPGTGTSDSIPARLSHGEYVVPAHRVAEPGVLRHLEAIRSGGSVRVPSFSVRTPGSFDGDAPRFSRGGLVSSAQESLRGGEHHLRVDLSPDLTARQLHSRNATDALISVIGENRDSVKSMLQI